MSDTFEIDAVIREDLGKGSSRRLRRLADHIPAIIYGGGKTPTPLTIIRKDLEKALESEAFYSHVLTINVGKVQEKAILKDLQRHPAKNLVMHADFMRVRDDVEIRVNVPVHFLNEATCYGVKTEGGMIQHMATDMEIECLPADMPEYLELDMLNARVGDIFHLSDIKLPKGVISIELAHGEDHDQAIASVLAPKTDTGSDDTDAPEAPAAPASDQEMDAPAEDGED